VTTSAPKDPASRTWPVSAIVTTFNEEDNIAACLESLAWCAEILVVDSFSQDRTCEIVRGFERVQLLQRRYFGPADQKNWIIPQARYDWVLILDADERCTPELTRELQELLESGPAEEAYALRRRLFFFGGRIRFCGFRNDRVVRFFLRDRGRYDGKQVHERLVTRGSEPAIRHAPTLSSALDHHMADDLHEYVQRITRYGYWGAAQAFRDGKHSSLARAVTRALWRFLRAFILKGGALDGGRGLLFCLLQAYGTYAKWSLLWDFRRQERAGRTPKLPELPNEDDGTR